MIRAKFLVSMPRVVFSVIYCFGITTLLYGPWVSVRMIVLVLVFSELSGYYGRYKLGGVMGDYLGATICLTEVSVLSFLIMPTAPMRETLRGRMVESEGSVTDVAQVVMDFLLPHDDKKLKVIARTVATMTAFLIWRWVVRGPKSDTAPSDTEIKGVTPQTQATPPSPDKVAAQKVLSSSVSFREKYDVVQTYLDVLAKPVGSLGTLEDWAARLCTLQGTMQPKAEPVGAIIFAGDHGVAASPDEGGEGCSLYPQSVTRAILAGLQGGVAGASILAKDRATLLSVVDVGVVGGPFDGPTVLSADGKLVNGTRNFCLEAAMTAEEMDRCLQMGKDSVVQMVARTACTVIALGEVGIGNTTTASALIAALTDHPIETLVGGGAFAARSMDESAVKKKIAIVQRAMEKHRGLMRESSAVLCKVGGAEVAALVGAILEASQRNIAVLVDGFIVTAAALVAAGMNPNVCRVLFFSTRSAERGQIVAVEKIQNIARDNNLPIPAGPALSMGLRMGEGTGALLAVPILQSACSVVCHMATIQEILGPPKR
jgi:nicotinate-nucleotide--dimethylbenzimidazole phosphoribosyltransferase